MHYAFLYNHCSRTLFNIKMCIFLKKKAEKQYYVSKKVVLLQTLQLYCLSPGLVIATYFNFFIISVLKALFCTMCSVFHLLNLTI